MGTTASTTNCPRYPYYPPHGNIPRAAINDTLTKELHGVLYDVMVKTSIDQVYQLDTDTTLTELLADIGESLAGIGDKVDETFNTVSEILADAPENMDTFKEVWEYVRLDGDPKSALIEMIDSKVEKEEGKGLSTHDLTDILYEQLVNDYTREELDEKFQIVVDEVDAKVGVIATEVANHEARIASIESSPNMIMTNDPDVVPAGLVEGDVYAVLMEEDN